MTLDLCGRVVVQSHERLISISTGGGGYGRLQEREPERVAEHVREGWITPQRAREVYAVVVDEVGTVDEGATNALRSEVRRDTARKGNGVSQ